ncbi:MAG: multidrug efflux pump subunit AcrA (membrane-fusion protein) [Planctomycetota bacterium]|jgi:multidrug efflux pump subunit AcrA (membrane-fusion protein)
MASGESENGRGAPGSLRSADLSPGIGESGELSLWRAMLAAPDKASYQAAWLTLACHRLGGVASAVLILASDDGFRPCAAWPSGSSVAEPLARAVERALETRRPASFVGASERQSDTRHVIAQPLDFDGKLQGAVACELVGAHDEAQLQRALGSLQWGAGWIEFGLERDRTLSSEAQREQLLGVLELAACTAEREGFRRSATALATEIAIRLNCDRVSIGLSDGARIRLQAVSHTASFEAKSNLSRAVEGAMDECFDQETVVLTPAAKDANFQVRSAHEALMVLGSSKNACSLPFGRDERIYGVVTLERSLEDPFSSKEIDLVDVALGYAGPLLELERRAERGMLKLTWAGMRGVGRKLVTPGSPAFKGALLALLVIVLFFSFAKGTYRVKADAVVEATQQRVIVAPFPGYVAEAPLRAGDIVHKGDLLCLLDDRDLKLERGRLASQREQYEKRYNQALAKREAAQVNIIRAQIDQITAQLELTIDQLARTRVLAPIDGVVVEGDLSQAFGSPLERGQILFQVAPLDKLRLVLLVDERDVEFVEIGQSGNLVPTSFPGEDVAFSVTRVTPVSAAMEGANVFRVEAQLSTEQLGGLLPGMEGVAKIDTAPQLLVWNVAHEGVDWLRLFLWKWSP